MPVTAGVSEAALATRAKLRGEIGQTKVKRYWPGKAPEWADEPEDVRMQKVDALDRKHDDSGVARKDDPRLRRLAQTRAENREEEKEDEDALEERRRRIREKNLKRAQEEADLLPVEEEDEVEEEEDEEDESEYETDSEDDMPGIAMIKPVFVPKAERYTVSGRERLEAEEQALEELAKRKLEMRKLETKQIVVEEVRKDEEIRNNMLLQDANIGDVETDDEINEAEQYEVWKTREIARIKRERDAKEAMLREREKVEKLRNMTEQERKNPKPSSDKPKKKWNYAEVLSQGSFLPSGS
ncbi:hypothetical protein F2Q69_00024652 [Brassica cretica]|uniref:Micro-fibrillar-associated protein 1 C-terminal domain-containing protein n=1 Tax=Brassica cretica TaxID=69181 RepID=A0A8S9QDP3_BRACR|nr:hypothetical protein F2Q69_00024652 [Brassica cretica]